MYLFISKHEVIPYKGEILKMYLGNKLVKTIANPTDEHLRDFGYMEMIIDEEPEYDLENQQLITEYEVTDGKIHCSFVVEDIVEEQEEPEEE